MKLKKTARLLALVPLFMVLLAWPFVPEQIPAHYGIDGAVTRWGSRYELFIMPVFTVVFTEFMLWIARIAKKQEQANGKHSGNNNEKFVVIAAIAVQLIYDIIMAVMIYTSLKGVTSLGSAQYADRLIVFALGILCIITGNFMPKLKRNSVAGLRTPSSTKNDAVWKRCQRFGGITMALTGAVTALAAFLSRSADMAGVIFLLMLCVTLPVDIFYCRYAAKQDEKAQAESEK